jgi:hypothetical protein
MTPRSAIARDCASWGLLLHPTLFAPYRMTRFADVRNDNTRPVELGPCDCPPGDDGKKPHEVDVVHVYAELGYRAMGAMHLAGTLPDGRFSYYEAKMALLDVGIAKWDLRGANGKVMPLNKGSIGLMREADIEKIATVLDEIMPAGAEPVPNESSASSATGSPESASSTQTTQTPALSTTA